MSRRHRQERELTEAEQELLVAVGRCSRDLADLLAGARRKSQKSVPVFASDHIASALHRAVEVYGEAFERAKVADRKQLDRQLARYIRADEVRDIAEEIADTEVWAISILLLIILECSIMLLINVNQVV